MLCDVASDDDLAASASEPTHPRTDRLRLEPIGPHNAHDFWLVHNDDEVARWYDGWKPTREEAEREAQFIDWSWRALGVHKWMAYERAGGDVVGRGGLSRTPVDDDWGQLHALLPSEPWAEAVYGADDHAPPVHAHWLEIGWALRHRYWGRGYASEIGRAGLAFAFDVLDMRAVVSCTVRHNARSRAVMERIGMTYAGEIRSRGEIDGVEGQRDDAPFAVYVMLRTQWRERDGNGQGSE